MEVFQNRLDSFFKSKRVKSPSGVSGSVSLKWPHPSHFIASPNALAEAGFFFCPTWDDRDTVKCYMCAKELSDWVQDDDPFDIHWTKCRTSCPWAIVRCGLKDDVDRDGMYASDPIKMLSS
jgi:Inhibitor of Apoptosis domain